MLDITATVARLRAVGSDDTSVEVKAATGGLPASIASTLSALANLPGGGIIILGLDEATGFRPVSLQDPAALKAGLASIGDQALVPPVRMTFEDAEVDGMPVVVAVVPECPVAQKPCHVAADGRAYIRGFDGDYTMSELERQAFLVMRDHPVADREPVPGTSRDDLDPHLLTDWLATVRERQPGGLGRFRDDDELLRRAGVTTSVVARGERPSLTVAGLLALGTYPQQWLPRAVVNVASNVTPGARIRATSAQQIDGPIPVMLARTLAWARDTIAHVIRDDLGAVTDDLAYPQAAIRELVSNALVHRDLAAWSRGFAIEIRQLPDRLVIANPGGLFGITVDRLGVEGVSSARNGHLLTICQFVRIADQDGRGGRVVEALATGIPTVNASIAAAGLPAPRWVDTAIRFTAILPRGPSPTEPVPPPVRSMAEVAVWDALATGPMSVAEIRERTDLGQSNIHKVLRVLRGRNVVVLEGGQGRRSTYRRIEEGGRTSVRSRT